MIPKKIHFIWIGNNEIPISSKNYIKKWLEIYDDYEIIIWNDKMVDDCNLIPDF